MQRLLSVFLLLASSQAFGAYAYNRRIAIDYTKCGGASALSNFPVLVSISHTTFKTVANGGHINNTVTQSGGNSVTMPTDMMFTSDSRGTAKVPWEVEAYDGSNGILIAWVKISSISCTADTPFYVFYGDPGVTTQQSTGSYSPANVWDSSFGGVWHLSDPTNPIGSSGANNGVNINVTAAAGEVAGAGAFNGSSTWITVNDSASLDPSSVTASAWVKLTSLANDYSAVIHKGSSGQYFEFFVKSNGTLAVYLIASGGAVNYDGSGSHILTTGTWYHLSFTYDATTGLNAYVNGALDKSIGAQGTLASTAPMVLSIGRDSVTAGRVMNGLIDEPRVSSVARSANWLATEYNNQQSPGNIGANGFLKYGPEPVGGTTGVRRRVVIGE
jgi:hypothetical protein